MTVRKSAGKSPKKKEPALIPQPNGGALLSGGKPGNVGNPNAPGRPPSAIREKLRGSFAERVRILEKIADGEALDPSDRMKAIDLMGKYGLGARKDVDEDQIRERLSKTLAIITAELDGDVAEALISKIEVVWRT